MPEKLSEILYRWRVRVGTLSLIVVLAFARPSVKSIVAGGVAALVGLAVRAWAAGHLRKEKELTVSGPYQYTRNPLYLGNLIIGVGVGLAARSVPVVGILVVYFLLFYPVIIRKEKDRMARLFPDAYRSYRAFVPLFIPRIRKPSAGGNGAFHWSVFRKNRELRAAAGTAAFWLLLVLRMLVAA
jgi:protein-S-isoprenylcysteine O-methyltransferase Ste14